MVTVLLQHGANPDVPTKDNYTALHIAAKEGQEEVVAVLLDRGAKLDSNTKVSPGYLTSGRLSVYSLRLRALSQPRTKTRNVSARRQGFAARHTASKRIAAAFDAQNCT